MVGYDTLFEWSLNVCVSWSCINFVCPPSNQFPPLIPPGLIAEYCPHSRHGNTCPPFAAVTTPGLAASPPAAFYCRIAWNESMLNVIKFWNWNIKVCEMQSLKVCCSSQFSVLNLLGLLLNCIELGAQGHKVQSCFQVSLKYNQSLDKRNKFQDRNVV